VIEKVFTWIKGFGLLGMIIYAGASAVITGLAIPLGVIDLFVGMIYDFISASIILLAAKCLGAALSFYIANNLISEKSKNFYK